MNDETFAQLRALLQQQPLAALATLHDGEPAVSLVPWAPWPDGSGLLIHVSRLATHTHDIEAHDRVAMLIHAADDAQSADAQSADAPSADGSRTALARPRVSLSGRAQRLPRDADAYAQGQAAYLARLPEAADLFGFADFSLWRIAPEQVRFVAGFGRAHAVPTAQWQAALRPDRPSAL